MVLFVRICLFVALARFIIPDPVTLNLFQSVFFGREKTREKEFSQIFLIKLVGECFLGGGLSRIFLLTLPHLLTRKREREREQQ